MLIHYTEFTLLFLSADVIRCRQKQQKQQYVYHRGFVIIFLGLNYSIHFCCFTISRSLNLIDYFLYDLLRLFIKDEIAKK